ESYHQQLGDYAINNSGMLEVENPLSPRPTDPNFAVAGEPGDAGLGARLIRDNFLIFPSVQPLSRNGLASNSRIAANDTLYRTPNEYLYSPQHPQSIYRIRVQYESEGFGDNSSIALNAVQVRAGSERILVDGRQLRRDVD